MTQRMYPVGDYTNGGWTGTAGLFSSVDEATPDDADYVSSPSNPSGETLELSLSDPLDPVTGANDSVQHIRVRKSGGKSASLTYDLLNSSGTVKVTQSLSALPSAFAQTDTIASSNAWAAGELVGARLQLAGSVSGGGSPTTVDVSWYEFDVPDPAPPPAPTGLVADPLDGGAFVHWDSYSGPLRTGYYVLQDGVEVARVADSFDVDHTITGLTNGTAYDIEVGFYGPGGDGPTAGPVAVTPQVQAPTSLSALAGNAQVQLSWTMSPGATGHNVYRDGVLIDTIGAVTSYTDSTVTNETQYSYEVSSLDGAYESAHAGPVLVTPTAAQTYYPASDNFVSGWTFAGPGSAYLCLDSSLGSYLQGGSSAGSAEVQMPVMSDPGAGGTVRLEAYVEIAGGNQATIRLSSSAFGTVRQETITGSFTGPVSFELTQGEIDLIDWSDSILVVSCPSTSFGTKVMYARLAVAASTGPPAFSGDGTVAVAFGTAGSGSSSRTGSGSTAVAVAATGAGSSARSGSGSAAVAFTTAGAGTAAIPEVHAGSGSVAVAFTSSGAGTSSRSGAGSTAATFTAAGSGSSARAGSSSTALAFTTTGAGASSRSSSGVLSLTFATSGSGSSSHADGGALALTFTVSGSGSSARSGQGSTAATFTTAGSGSALEARSGSGQVSVGFSVTGSATTARSGASSASLAFLTAGGFTTTRQGSAALSVALTASGSGSSDRAGSGQVAATFTTAGSGSATVADNRTGSGSVTVAFTATSSASSSRSGQAASSATFTTAGQGASSRTGSGSTAATFTTTGAGTAAQAASGSGSTAVAFTVAGNGQAGHTGTGSVAVTFGASSTANVGHTGQGAAQLTFTVSGLGSAARTGSGQVAATFANSGAGSKHGTGQGALAAAFTLTGEFVNPDALKPGKLTTGVQLAATLVPGQALDAVLAAADKPAATLRATAGDSTLTGEVA